MQKIGLVWLSLALVGCGLGDLVSGDQTPTVPETESSVEVSDNQTLTIGDQTFDIEMADTQPERELGLMFRESLPLNAGMLFVWEQEAPRNFWMKNTLVPLDMIWINGAGSIVDIQAAEPCSADPCPIYRGAKPAQFVLELNQGVLQAPVGSRVEFQWLR